MPTLPLIPADASTDALALVVWLGAIAAVLLVASGLVEGVAAIARWKGGR